MSVADVTNRSRLGVSATSVAEADNVSIPWAW